MSSLHKCVFFTYGALGVMHAFGFYGIVSKNFPPIGHCERIYLQKITLKYSVYTVLFWPYLWLHQPTRKWLKSL